MGLRYRKGQGLKENMVSADEIMEKKRGLSWTDSAGLASFLIQMSTSNLSDLDNLKRQKDELDGLFNRNNNYPYSEEYLRQRQEEAIIMIEDSLNKIIEQLGILNIGSEINSMNEGLRITNQSSSNSKISLQNYESFKRGPETLRIINNGS